MDNRPEAVSQRKLQEMVDNSPQSEKLIQLHKILNHSASSISNSKPIQLKLDKGLKERYKKIIIKMHALSGEYGDEAGEMSTALAESWRRMEYFRKSFRDHEEEPHQEFKTFRKEYSKWERKLQKGKRIKYAKEISRMALDKMTFIKPWGF